MDKNSSNVRPIHKNVTKIVVLSIILVIVAGIWVLKKSQNDMELAVSGNADFALHVTDKIDMEKLKSYGVPIIIDFGADSCIPCKEMAPVLKELNEELQGKAVIKFVDVWKYQALAQGYPIRVIPTQVFIDSNGKPFIPSESLLKQIQLYPVNDSGKHVFTIHEGGMTKDQLLSALKEMGMK